MPMTLPILLDARTLPPNERHLAIFAAFDGLAPGEGFVLLCDHDPRPLLSTFQNERAGRFDWSPLEQGPETWRTLITSSARGEIPMAVTDYLSWDHDRLDGLLEQATGLLGGGDPGAARGRFAEFQTGLRRHIRMEEEVLFPAFEQATGMPPTAGPTAVMRSEHREIESVLDLMAGCLAGGSPDPSVFAGLRQALFAVLGDHNEKEEQVLYPMTDRSLSLPAQRAELIRRMQSV